VQLQKTVGVVARSKAEQAAYLFGSHLASAGAFEGEGFESSPRETFGIEGELAGDVLRKRRG
jgi:hypothetical protein